jgi:hypothetical protein
LFSRQIILSPYEKSLLLNKNYMELENYKTAGEWYESMRNEGFTVPLALCIEVSKFMKKYNCTFPEAFKFLVDNKKIFLAGKSYIYDLTGDNL